MSVWFDILSFSLIAAALIPLVLLGVYFLASHFELPIADRLLTVTARMLSLQWLVGGLVNILLGFALAGLGIWLMLHFSTPWHRWVEAVMVPFGAWRVWRGASVLWGFQEKGP